MYNSPSVRNIGFNDIQKSSIIQNLTNAVGAFTVTNVSEFRIPAMFELQEISIKLNYIFTPSDTTI